MIGNLRFLFINIYLLKWETHTQGVKMLTLLKKAPFVLILLIGETNNELILHNVSVDTKLIQLITHFQVHDEALLSLSMFHLYLGLPYALLPLASHALCCRMAAKRTK